MDMQQSDAKEAVRWHTEHFGFPSAEEFERVRREDWLKGRNHRREKGGITREVRDDGEWVTVGDEHHDLLPALIVGRTIVAIDREPDTGKDWQHYENGVTITFDDGSRLRFDGEGYDASSCITQYAPGEA